MLLAFRQLPPEPLFGTRRKTARPTALLHFAQSELNDPHLARELLSWVQHPRLHHCLICYDDAKDPFQSVCGHTFCTGCISAWSIAGGRNSSRCPLCSKHLDGSPEREDQEEDEDEEEDDTDSDFGLFD